MKSKYTDIFILLLLAALICSSCSDDDDDGGNGTCSESACMAWCTANVWGLDHGINEWGKLEARCSEYDRCMCQDYPCYPQNCDSWCRSSQGADGGLCDVFECACR